ncbi:Josephin-2 [Amphibalanus amphitrite]|uniref:Josephin-2 n=1 Tax=Amphibalanus amphitrite TaxID=1232801 RepID=A0A6A4WLL8_AMPAM|nr:josephin-2-like [Amphibalanus amphitrite]XP_043193784.1 josephin-2-like [Amphibalanus amphitrite]XP_043197244.1 josephin-2-like [Amphibalanus amphitrite]XP_043197245.1 josephin-2-like [Amphibalanus amphitrite]XP_043197246.1 josephin-2-like [Amphibalanus amphitrite]KAF0303044.1 Josephin-2 [Amphibalanus amphitrite]KAF0303045.1 Josephin-2 [Amphibalanus amphitrite]KAF0304560.1 Josephin-2 [Amphibalanus amphitrite]KAF0304561.1 Josephin-2 [Amphibalanus amphitrite]
MPFFNKTNITQDGIYHEKQVRELCALHALNNVLQCREFSERQLDAICERLAPGSWLNPHRSVLGTGNFDVNVLMAALQQRGRDARWFDKRRNVSDLVLEHIEGFILNLFTEYRLGPLTLPYSRRHWVALRRLRTAGLPSSEPAAYYNLDSKLQAPERIGTEEDLIRYLDERLRSKDVELFVVVSQEAAEDGRWIRPAPAAPPVDRTADSECAPPPPEAPESSSGRARVLCSSNGSVVQPHHHSHGQSG